MPRLPSRISSLYYAARLDGLGITPCQAGCHHLAWDRERGRLTAFRHVCWYSWPEQTASMARLLDERFAWVLPGHGQRHHLPAETMHAELAALVERMRAA